MSVSIPYMFCKLWKKNSHERSPRKNRWEESTIFCVTYVGFSHLASFIGGSEVWDKILLINDGTDLPVEEGRVIKIEADNPHYVQFLLLLG